MKHAEDGASGSRDEPALELICRDILVARGRRHWMENSGCEARGSFTSSGFRLDQGGRVLVAQGELSLSRQQEGIAELLGALTVELRARGAEPVALMDSLQLAPGSIVSTSSHGLSDLRARISRVADRLGLEVCGGDCGRSLSGFDSVLLVVVGVLPRVPQRDRESRGQVGDPVFRVSLPQGPGDPAEEQILALGHAFRDAYQQEELSWVGSCRAGGLLAAADWLETTGLGLRLHAGSTDLAALTAPAPGDFLVSAIREKNPAEFLPPTVGVQEVGAISAERLLDLETAKGPTLRLRPEEIRRDQKSPEFVSPDPDDLAPPEASDDWESVVLELVPEFRRNAPRDGSARVASPEGLPRLAGDVSVLRVGARRDLLALAIGSVQPFSSLDPYIGACLAVCRVTRGLAAAGAEPLGLLVTLPGEKGPGATLVYEGLRHAADALGTTIEMATALGVGFSVPGVVALGRPTATHLVPSAFQRAGDVAVLLGQTREELGGSVFDAYLQGASIGTPPWVDLGSERRLQDLVRSAGEADLLKSAFGLNAGGLIRGVLHASGADEPDAPLLGLRGEGDESLRPEAWLFAESPSRILASVAPKDFPRLKEKALRAEVPLRFLGEIGGDLLEIEGQLRIALESLRRAWHGTNDEAG